MRRTPFLSILASFMFVCFFFVMGTSAFEETIISPPPRAEGEGPFTKLVLHGVTVIEGTGALPLGPAQIVIQNNRITHVTIIGTPGLPIPDPAT